MHDQSDSQLGANRSAQLFLRCAPDAALIVAPTAGDIASWSIIACNERACLLYGYQSEELIGHALQMLLFDVGGQTASGDHAARLQNGALQRIADLHMHKDGTPIAVELAGIALPADDAELVVVTVHDVTHHWQTERRLAAEHAVSLTERSRAEQAARAGEERNAAILRAALDGIIIMDHSGRITEYNPAAEQILGFTREAAIGRDMADLIIPPVLREHHRHGLAHYLATGEGPIIGKRVELTALRADNTEIPIELTVTSIPTDGPPLFTGFIRDLSARKQAEQAIRLQAQLLDHVEQAVIASDVVGTITYWNRWAETLYGWASAEVLGRDIMDMTPAPAMRAEASAIMERLRAGESWSGEFELQHRDGTTFPAFVTDSPVYDASGMLVGIVGVSVDMAERKRREEGARFLAAAGAVLASSLDYTRTLTSLADLAVPHIAEWCAVDMVEADGSFRRLAVAHIDPAKVELAWELERRFGFDPDLSQGAAKVMRTGKAEMYPEITDELLASIATTAEHLRMLQRVGLRSGMIVPLTVRGRTLGAISLGSGASGRRFNMQDLRLAEDLADRASMAIEHARLYAEAQAATAEAQAAVRLRDQFLSVAAHELRTPVTSVHGYSQLLQMRAARDQNVSARDLRAIEVIVDQSERLSTLISTLLDVSRIQIGQFSLECQPLDLCALGRRIADDARLMLEQHTLLYHCPDTPVLVDGDALRLEQVVQNLLQNAIKYSPEGGPIALRIVQQDEQAVITVTDSGVGIPQEAQAKLFQRFYRASNAALSNISGLGIGLYVVKEIVTRHGGEIGFDSVEGQGSAFMVRLPLAQARP